MRRAVRLGLLAFAGLAGFASCAVSERDGSSPVEQSSDVPSVPSTDTSTVSDTASSGNTSSRNTSSGSTPVGDEDTSAVRPEGFTTATVEITKADGSVCEVCMWLADSADERRRGLMGVTDLGAAEGMAFLFEQPSNGGFWMFQTVTPLSIAWFAPAPSGEFGEAITIADMEPCPSDDSSDCPSTPSGGEYQLAIEVFQGDMASVGITDGAAARLVPGTESTECPVAE